MNKKKVGILFGGQSAEHEVSIKSAKNVYNALNKTKYEVCLLGIDRKGEWHAVEEKRFIAPDFVSVENVATKEFDIAFFKTLKQSDVVFPVLHGPMGEDGTVQGMLKLMGVPFVGPGVLGSAVGMDKDVMKRLLRDGGIPIGKFITLKKGEGFSFEHINQELGLPFFVKPANLGSSIGVSKVHTQNEFEKAVKSAFEFDTKILCEEYIQGREVECAVLGNENPISSIAGEIIPENGHEFYDYDAKYIDNKGAALKIPAEISEETLKKVQSLAIETFRTLCCEGMGRVDMFVKENGDIYVNEINTIPGFTKISMYPKLWEASGIGYTELIDRLIQLALERFEREDKLKLNFV